MTTKVSIIFPYSGYKAGSPREQNFWDLVDRAQKISASKPVVVLNRDTENKGQADDFLNDPRAKNVDLTKVWSVDTCQMWLHGWGYILDKYRNISRVVQLPGDIDFVADRNNFLREVELFISHADPWDFIIGDFSTGDKFSTKDLIDLFGTIPLLANWFPAVAKAIQQLGLQKPRSEFLNMKASVLKQLLACRKFAYEQTLNMLILSWDLAGQAWKYQITRHPLGTVQDDPSARRYGPCLDQIERTERMLKLLWRELIAPGIGTFTASFDQYDLLDQRSTAIRETARITIRSLLGI